MFEIQIKHYEEEPFTYDVEVFTANGDLVLMSIGSFESEQTARDFCKELKAELHEATISVFDVAELEAEEDDHAR